MQQWSLDQSLIHANSSIVVHSVSRLYAPQHTTRIIHSTNVVMNNSGLKRLPCKMGSA